MIKGRTVHTGSPNRHPNAYLEFKYCKLNDGHIAMKKYFKSPFINAILQVLTPFCSACAPTHTLSLHPTGHTGTLGPFGPWKDAEGGEFILNAGSARGSAMEIFLT